MASRHNHAPWRKAILVPFWIVQQLFLLFMIGSLALSISILSHYNDLRTSDVSDEVWRVLHIIVPIWLAICSVSMILTITEIALLARHNLKPLVFVILNVVKTGTWTVLFILDIFSTTTASVQAPGAIKITFDAILLLAFWIPLIYGVIVWRRPAKTKGEYAPVVVPTTTEAYPSQYQPFVTEVATPAEPTRPPGARRLTYNHERDTRFESFRTERRSLSNPEVKLGNDVIISGSGSVPSVTVEDHDFDDFGRDNARRGMNSWPLQ